MRKKKGKRRNYWEPKISPSEPLPEWTPEQNQFVIKMSEHRASLEKYLIKRFGSTFKMYGIDREDVIQEVFLKVGRSVNSGASFRNQSSELGWLISITFNRSLEFIRNAQRDHLSPDTDNLSLLKDGERENFQIVQAIQSDQYGLVLVNQIYDFLKKYGLESDTLIRLKEEGYMYEEISQIIGCPVGTVKTRIFRATKALNKFLSGIRAGNLRSREASQQIVSRKKVKAVGGSA